MRRLVRARWRSSGDVVQAVRRAGRRPRRAYREGEVIVAFRAADERPRRRARAPRGRRRARRVARGRRRRYLVTARAGDERARGRASASADARGAYAEPNGIVRKTQGTTFNPDDRFYRFQWNLRLIGAERTWAIQKGKPAVAVAVLDTGVAYEDYTDPSTGRPSARPPTGADTGSCPASTS